MGSQKTNKAVYWVVDAAVNRFVLNAVSGTVYHVMDEPIYRTVNRAVCWPVYWSLYGANL